LKLDFLKDGKLLFIAGDGRSIGGLEMAGKVATGVGAPPSLDDPEVGF
jgi:hypothetical protein